MKHRIESMSEIAIQEQMTKTGQVGMGLKPRLMR
jgi:hypothetical protein